MIDILKRMKDGEEISKEDDDLYDKKCVEYVKRTGSRLGLRKNFKDDDVDADVDDDPSETESQEEEEWEDPEDEFYKTTLNDIKPYPIENPYDKKYQPGAYSFEENFVSGKEFERIKDLVAKTTELKISKWPTPKDRLKKLESAGVKKDDLEAISKMETMKELQRYYFNKMSDKYDDANLYSIITENWDQEFNKKWSKAIHYTFVKHPDKFTGVSKELDSSIEEQQKINKQRKDNLDKSKYFWRGMSLGELLDPTSGSEQSLGMKDQSWSVSSGVANTFAHDMWGNVDGIILRVPKEDAINHMHDVNYSVLKMGDDAGPIQTLGRNHFWEEEYRLQNRDLSKLKNVTVELKNENLPEDDAEREALIGPLYDKYDVVISYG